MPVFIVIRYILLVSLLIKLGVSNPHEEIAHITVKHGLGRTGKSDLSKYP
ncbi:hypothetical protein PPEP_a2478 [Pseudoalteromonas peptidolytica F12-50-A1]|uniref:Uncharacterized protein n=1 Tax=Pseudoalteromonas peptidolytica F12-50-A1 TaxID=1315280 RepID=A0A8I0MSV5_9GAMM|nr:hypothetical protein [Pseudoalteromonas peptidolytica F12-50-A1]